MPASSELPDEKKARRKYRLPTEAEWEYACRGGKETPYHFGNAISAREANFNGKGTLPVGSHPANAFGLYDMHGNVWEWCSDWYDKDYYKSGVNLDPQGPTTGTQRVLRGGAWTSAAHHCRTATCNAAFPVDLPFHYIGFRVVCIVENIPAEGEKKP